MTHTEESTSPETACESLPLERLEAEITELAGHLAAAECRWLLLVAEYDRRSGYEEWGCRSCAHWLNWQCGLDLHAARERVRVARALVDLPVTTTSFAAGRLSYSKVRALSRVATPENESALVSVAEHATAAHVERTVRVYRSVLASDDETQAANARHMARYLRYDWADDGSLEGTFRIPPEMAAIFLKSVEVARERIPPDPDAEMRPAGRARNFANTNSDALMLMAEAFLTQAVTPGNSDRFQIVVNVDDDVLANDADGMCELDGGPALPPETARRLACDASIVQMKRDEAGQPVWTSVKAPSLNRAARRAVRARDRGCRFPGCGGRIFTHIHHVRHRARGGGNELTNLVELCWFHHRLVHEGGWNLRFDSTGAVLAIRPNGNVLPRPEPTEARPGDTLEDENRELGIEIEPTTCIPRWYGERLDLDEIVSGLFATEPSGGGRA